MLAETEIRTDIGTKTVVSSLRLLHVLGLKKNEGRRVWETISHAVKNLTQEENERKCKKNKMHTQIHSRYLFSF